MQWVFRHDNRIQVRQINLTLPDSAHSAVAVRIEDSGWIYLDPFNGYAFADPDTGKLLWIEDVIQKLHNGTPIGDMAIPLRPGDKTYRIDLNDIVAYAFDDELMIISRHIPIDGKTGRFTLGKVDGSSEDVFREAIENKLTSMFSFIGAHYYTGFIFRYIFDPGEISNGAGIRFTFTQPLPQNPDLPASNIEPQLKDNKTLVYVLKPGDKLLELDYRSFPNGRFYDIDRFDVIAM